VTNCLSRFILKLINDENGLTQRAPDGWESPRFQAGCWLEVGSAEMALSHPAHPRVTHTVGRLKSEAKAK
jgi:hypothetical protein